MNEGFLTAGNINLRPTREQPNNSWPRACESEHVQRLLFALVLFVLELVFFLLLTRRINYTRSLNAYEMQHVELFLPSSPR